MTRQNYRASAAARDQILLWAAGILDAGRADPAKIIAAAEPLLAFVEAGTTVQDMAARFHALGRLYASTPFDQRRTGDPAGFVELARPFYEFAIAGELAAGTTTEARFLAWMHRSLKRVRPGR